MHIVCISQHTLLLISQSFLIHKCVTLPRAMRRRCERRMYTYSCRERSMPCRASCHAHRCCLSSEPHWANAGAYPAYTAYRPIVLCPSGRRERWITDLVERAYRDHDDHTHWSHDDLTALGPIRFDSNAIIPKPWFSPESLIGTIRTIRTIRSYSFTPFSRIINIYFFN